MWVKCFYLGVYGINCFLVYDENNIVYFFDCGGCNLEKVYEFISEYNLDLKYIVLIYGYGDYIEGFNDLVFYYLEVKVYIGEEDKDFLYNFEFSLLDVIFGEFFKFKGEIYIVKESDMVGDFKVIDIFGYIIGLKSFYYEKDKILILGDILFRRSYGWYDLFIGSLEMLCYSLKKLLKLLDEIVVYNGYMDNIIIGEERRFLERVGIF